MGKNRDIIQMLLLVIIGMFVPFLGAIVINFGINLTQISDWFRIVTTFAHFLLIFALELLIVYLYYMITYKIANKKLEKIKPK